VHVILHPTASNQDGQPVLTTLQSRPLRHPYLVDLATMLTSHDSRLRPKCSCLTNRAEDIWHQIS
jgi:hypothetical protein